MTDAKIACLNGLKWTIYNGLRAGRRTPSKCLFLKFCVGLNIFTFLVNLYRKYLDVSIKTGQLFLSSQCEYLVTNIDQRFSSLTPLMYCNALLTACARVFNYYKRERPTVRLLRDAYLTLPTESSTGLPLFFSGVCSSASWQTNGTRGSEHFSLCSVNARIQYVLYCVTFSRSSSCGLDVLLTVHLSIILVINQLDAQILVL